MKSLDILEDLGMRNIIGSNMFLFLFYQSSYAIELELSSYVIHLTYETSCLIVHTTYMFRLRPKLRWRFVVPSGMPKFYACRSVGVRVLGDLGSFFVCGHGARIHGNLQI